MGVAELERSWQVSVEGVRVIPGKARSLAMTIGCGMEEQPRSR